MVRAHSAATRRQVMQMITRLLIIMRRRAMYSQYITWYGLCVSLTDSSVLIVYTTVMVAYLWAGQKWAAHKAFADVASVGALVRIKKYAYHKKVPLHQPDKKHEVLLFGYIRLRQIVSNGI